LTRCNAYPGAAGRGGPTSIACAAGSRCIEQQPQWPWPQRQFGLPEDRCRDHRAVGEDEQLPAQVRRSPVGGDEAGKEQLEVVLLVLDGRHHANSLSLAESVDERAPR
jgi:hypothetical protein